eukprot:m51a1_g7867 hypothetical protein (597) ;mRNA; f:272922-274843
MSALAGAGCCAHCVLRFTCATRNISLLSESPATAAAVVARLSPAPVVYSAPPQRCTACLGLLAACHGAELPQGIAAATRASGFDMEDYALSIQATVSSLARQHALWLFLQDRFGTSAFAGRCAEDGDVVDIKEAAKWVLGPVLSRLLGLRFNRAPQFRVTIVVTHEETDHEARALLEAAPAMHQQQQRRQQRQQQRHQQQQQREDEGVEEAQPQPRAAEEDLAASTVQATKILRTISAERFRGVLGVPPAPVQTGFGHRVGFAHESVYVGGRYCKYSSNMSQSRYLNAEQRHRTPSSVEERVVDLLRAHFGADETRFSASGREDVDVRMLGEGRPFVVEMVNPRRALHSEADYAAYQAEINGATRDVQVAHLQRVSPEQVATVKAGEETKTKQYRCLVWVSRPLGPRDLEPLAAARDLAVQQRTPLRVLQRRSLATRPKVVHSMRAELLSPHWLVLHLTTQAGTYVKEFVHGDLGRTRPSLGDLLACSADILQLDVTGVHLDFPPPVRPAAPLPVSFVLPESFFLADAAASAASAAPAEATAAPAAPQAAVAAVAAETASEAPPAKRPLEEVSAEQQGEHGEQGQQEPPEKRPKTL